MDYSGRLAELQQSASKTTDYAARRTATLHVLAPSAGEAILDVGCGSGLLLREIAAAVGNTGKACGIDLSNDQLSAARANCADLANVELRVGDIRDLPYPDASFDAVASIQVLEYLDDVSRALAEIHRTLKPNGRVINFATVWDALFWHSPEPARTQRMLNAWRAHAPHPNLPPFLRALMANAGFTSV